MQGSGSNICLVCIAHGSLYQMVDQNMIRTHEGKWVFSEGKKSRFVTALDLIKCLKEIKYQRFLLKYATISELPSETITMVLLLFAVC